MYEIFYYYRSDRANLYKSVGSCTIIIMFGSVESVNIVIRTVYDSYCNTLRFYIDCLFLH